MEIAKQLKPTGRLNVDDIKRVKQMLRKGQKPVLDSKGKPVKNLTQKAKPMTPAQKTNLTRLKRRAMRDFAKKGMGPMRRKK